VSAEVEAYADTVRIHVRDTGVGIPEPEQAHIFDPFVQGQDEPGSRPLLPRPGPSRLLQIGILVLVRAIYWWQMLL